MSNHDERKSIRWTQTQIDDMVIQMHSQMTLDLLSKDSKHLFEQLCSEWSLMQGWRDVKRNRGTSGIDGQTIETFEHKLQEEIKQSKEELASWSYKPQSVRRVEIPKPDGVSTRTLIRYITSHCPYLNINAMV